MRVLITNDDGIESPGLAVLARVAREAGADEVVEMLHSSEFAGIVVPDSVSVAAVPGFSTHAWGAMPMGVRTAALG